MQEQFQSLFQFKKQMLFIAHKPTNLLLTVEHKIILTTQHQIFFTTLHFIEEYLVTQLTHHHPLFLQYSSVKSQALIATNSSLQLYWTDWQHKIELHLFIPLNHEKLYSIQWTNCWEVFGQFKQYSPKKVKLWKVQNIDEQFPSCFLGQLQFLMNKKHLVVYDHKTQTHNNIEWEESQQYLKVIHEHKLTLKAHRLNERVCLIQAGGILLYIHDFQVLLTIFHEGELIIKGEVATWLGNGRIKIYQIEESVINFLGECQTFDGHYYGATVHNNKLMILFYHFKEIRVRSMRLVSEEENEKYIQSKKQKSQYKYQHLHSNNDCLSQNQGKMSKKVDNKQQNTHMQVRSQRSKHSGKSIQSALKASITKFKKEFQRSFEDKKHNQNNILANLEKKTQCRDGDIRKAGNQEVRSETKFPRKEQSSKRLQELRKQISKQQNYDQNLESNCQVSNINQYHSSSLSSSIPYGAQTPVFCGLDHHSSFENIWQKIQVIDEEFDIEQCVGNIDQYNLFEKTISKEKSSRDQRKLSEQQPFIQNARSKGIEKMLESNKVNSSKKGKQSKFLSQSLSVITGNGKDELKSSEIYNKSNKKRVLNSNIYDQNAQTNQQIIPNNFLIDKCPEMPISEKIEQTYHNKASQNNSIKSSLVNQMEMKISNFRHRKISSKTESLKSQMFKSTVVEEKKKYTQILTEIYKKQPEKFDEQLQNLMGKVIAQKEARLFFAQHIRIFNPNLTKDKLLRLYKAVDDNPQNRLLMTKALSEFKLEEVPTLCLSFDPSLVDIFRIIEPTVYIEDLLEPNARLYQNFIQNYFKKNLSNQAIVIEEVKIELDHPRNLLNILLYMNDFFNLPIDLVFSLYTKEMIKQNYLDIIKKIMSSNIPKVCSIETTVFQQAAEKAIRQLFEENLTEYAKLQQILPLMNGKARNIYNEIINLAEDFSIWGIIFDTNKLLDLPNSKDSFCFLKDIISLTNASILVKMDLPDVLGMISKIKDGKAQSYYTFHSIQITKMLSQKLIQFGYATEAMSTLVPIATALKSSYLAALLIRHNKGHYSNRLANITFNSKEEFTNLFAQFFSGVKTKRNGDIMPQTVEDSKALGWRQFHQFCSQWLSTDCWELSYLIYTDNELAFQLVDESIITQAQLVHLCKSLGAPISKLKNIRELGKKGENFHIRMGSQSHMSSQSGNLHLTIRQKNKKKLKVRQRSLKAFENKYSRKHSSTKSLYEACEDTNPILFDIKFQVVPGESIKLLKYYYEQSTNDQFLEALKLVDRQRIGIIQRNVDKFKSIINLKLNVFYKHLVPFEYFFYQNQAWITTQAYLKTDLNIQNFWTFYLLIQLLYSKEIQVVFIFINKLILYIKNDTWSSVVSDILQKINLPFEFLETAAAEALERGLIQTNKVLINYLQ